MGPDPKPIKPWDVPEWYPGSGKGAPGSNPLTHQGRYGQLFRLCRGHGATSKGMLFALWTSLLFGKHFCIFITALLILNMSCSHIDYVNFLLDGSKRTCSNKIDVMQLSQLFLRILIKIWNPYYFVSSSLYRMPLCSVYRCC